MRVFARSMPMVCGAMVTSALAGEPSDVVPTFTDVTDQAGVSFTHDSVKPITTAMEWMTPGLAAGDFNRDGWIDLFVQGGEGQNAALFINNADPDSPGFTNRTDAWGINLTSVEGTFAAVADIDGDGWLDLYAGALFERNYVFRNTGNNCFVEIGLQSQLDMAAEPGEIGLVENTFGATFGDVDLDGDLDMFACAWIIISGGDSLMINNGTGVFTEHTQQAGLNLPFDQFWGFTPSLVDFDGDRYPELPIAADWSTSRYFINNTDLTFVDYSNNGTCTDENGMGSTIADYDNDGDLDWFVTSIYDDDGQTEGNWGITGNRLYRNDGEHQFTDVTDEAGVRDGGWGWGASFGDLNNDGWLDLVMTNGWSDPDGNSPDPTFLNDPTRVWMNVGPATPDGGPTFVDVAQKAGVDHTASGKGLVLFDYDNDGDLDLAITSNLDDLVLYRNDLPIDPQRWIAFDLIAPAGNAPDGFGATITVNINGESRVHVVHGGSNYMSQNPPRAHFGLTEAVPTIDSVHVLWPDGTSKWWYDVPTGQIAIVSPGNVDGDDAVGVSDLLAVLNAWGPCAQCAADTNGDGIVNETDLLTVIADWD